MKFFPLGWQATTYGAWGSGALLAFIASFLPWQDLSGGYPRSTAGHELGGAIVPDGSTTLILALAALGAMLVLLLARLPEALPCLVAFGSTAAIATIGIINMQVIPATFHNPNFDVGPATFSVGYGLRLVVAGALVSCVGSFAFPLLGLWHHYRKS